MFSTFDCAVKGLRKKEDAYVPPLIDSSLLLQPLARFPEAGGIPQAPATVTES
jgi:hypothetical protein